MTSGSAAAAGATRLGHTTLKLFERGVHMLIENNMAALRRELEDAGVEFIDLGRTEVPGVRLESEMGRSEMRPSRLALYLGALLLPLNAAAQSPAFSV